MKFESADTKPIVTGRTYFCEIQKVESVGTPIRAIVMYNDQGQWHTQEGYKVVRWLDETPAFENEYFGEAVRAYETRVVGGRDIQYRDIITHITTTVFDKWVDRIRALFGRKIITRSYIYVENAIKIKGAEAVTSVEPIFKKKEQAFGLMSDAGSEKNRADKNEHQE